MKPESPVFQAVAEQVLGARDEIVDAGVALVRSRIPSYSRLSDEEIREAIAHNIDMGIATIGTGLPPVTDLAQFDRRVQTRAAQGVPVEDMLRGMRLTFEPLDEEFTRLAEQAHLGTDDILIGARRLWDVIGTLTNRAALAYQDHLILATLTDVEARSDFLQKALNGAFTADQLATQALRYGLDPFKDVYVAVRGRPTGPSSESVRRDLERGGSTSDARAVIGYSSGDLIGIMPRRPLSVDGMIIGIGPETMLSEIDHSFRVAGRAFEAARREGIPGVYGVEDLTWRLAVNAEPAVSAALVRRYLDPLREEREFGFLVEQTLRAFLENDRDLTRTAKVLNVHPNTARYRLNRFCELTDVSLSSTRTLVDLAWLLEYRAIL